MQLVKGKLESGPQRIPALAGGDVKSAGGICQDVPKLPEIGCLSLILPILPGQTNLLDTFRNLIRIVSPFLPDDPRGAGRNSIAVGGQSLLSTVISRALTLSALGRTSSSTPDL